MKEHISVVIKPTLACDLDCRHCYHTPAERVPGTVSSDKLDRLFRMVAEEYESAWFIWHGGEPLTLPLRFYKDALALQERHFGKGSHRVGNTIQTNGTAIDRRFADFCRDKKVNLGISFEGPFNDALRQETDRVDRNLSYLSRKEHVFSVNPTVSAATVSKQREMYRHFRDRGIDVCFSPVLPMGCAAEDRSLVPDADEYIAESIRMFDEWLFDEEAEIPLIPHYLYLLNALGERVESDCAHSSCLGKWLCMHPDGSLYPCAKRCPEEFLMGDLDDIGRIGDAFASEGFRRILAGTVARREKCRSECDLYEYCTGECSINACYECGLESNGGDSCRIFREVFGHILGVCEGILRDRPDLSVYNKYVRDAVVGRLVNPLAEVTVPRG